MPVRSSEATWEGDLRDGNGEMTVGEGLFQGAYTYASRFQEGEGTNPEELIAAAHAGCFSMKLSGVLADDGYDPERIHTTARVHLEEGEITRIELDTESSVPGIDEDEYLDAAEEAKETCPVSQALAAVPEIAVEATLA